MDWMAEGANMVGQPLEKPSKQASQTEQESSELAINLAQSAKTGPPVWGALGARICCDSRETLNTERTI